MRKRQRLQILRWNHTSVFKAANGFINPERDETLILIMGGSGSGKSAYAESTAVEKAKDGASLFYLATMQVYDEEGEKKIARHRQQRQGKGFFTIEQPVDIAGAIPKIETAAPRGKNVVLLECLSNLIANEMFREQIEEAEAVSRKVAAEIRQLNDAVKELVIVTNNVFEDGICRDETTMAYIRSLGNVNAALAEMADCVVEIVAGIPVTVKETKEQL